jgi:hypothetical protein
LNMRADSRLVGVVRLLRLLLFGAGATNDRDISGMVLYVDGVKKYTIDNASHFDTRLSLSVGTHNLTIKAWDTSGRVTSKSQTVAVQ